ncbi:hypothetical protein [Luteitalea sp.]|jgi:hypothetical protein|uniref:hypothetical protein n=1 Tax=Luteitalea sp. TaxID=2004800 RepID=UPI0037C71B95
MTPRHVSRLVLLASLVLASPSLAQPTGAEPAPCSLKARTEGACDAAAPQPRDAAERPAAVDRDALWEGALLGGAVGAGYGLVGALLSDCPRGSDRGCATDRAALVALSTALGAGIGVAIDAISRPELTGAPLPGPPASERRMGLPPPSSRGAGVRFKLAW